MNFGVSGVAKGTGFGDVSPCLLVPSGPLSGGVEVGYFFTKTGLACSPDTFSCPSVAKGAGTSLHNEAPQGVSRVRMFPLGLPFTEVA
jgi:hypothetical protein